MTRGRISQFLGESLELANLVAGADFAFALELSGREQAELEKDVDLSFLEGAAVVGVAPSAVMQKKVDARGGDYAGLLARFIERLQLDGKRVLLLPHSARSGTQKTHNNDLPLCREIRERLSVADDVMFIDRELTSQQLRYLIGECELFVAATSTRWCLLWRWRCRHSSSAGAISTVRCSRCSNSRSGQSAMSS